MLKSVENGCWEVSQKLKLVTNVGGGVCHIMTITDKGGREGGRGVMKLLFYQSIIHCASISLSS